MSEHLTPEERVEWRKDAESDQWQRVAEIERQRAEENRHRAEKAERERDDLHFSRRQMEKSRDYQKARAEKAEHERDEAREALARVEALRDECAGQHGQCWNSIFARRVAVALAGTDPTDTEGDDR